MNLHLKLSTLSFFTLLFAGCGDNLNTDTYATKFQPSYPQATGYFIDAGVEGLEYSRLDGTYVTTKGGAFKFPIGDILTFKVGNLEIGSSIGVSTLTPKDLVSFQNLELNTSMYAPEVNNRVRLLMSLDSDNNPANGITIDTTTQNNAKTWDATVDYNLSESAFSTAINSATKNQLPNPLATKSQAEAHFARSLRCVYSGAYSGKWTLPSGQKVGFVGVMIQASNTQDANSSLGTIVTLGDGQDLNGDGNYSEYLFARGTHNMDSGYFNFSETGEFNVTSGGIVPSSQVVTGGGESLSYNRVTGSFLQKNPDTNVTEKGVYEASRVGDGVNTAYRYTGFGYSNTTNSENPQTDPILGLFTFDVDVSGRVVGLIHDARNNEEPPITGTVDYATGIVDMSLTYPNNGGTFKIQGTLAFDGTVNLDWYDETGTTKYGYIAGVGCQLQTHN